MRMHSTTSYLLKCTFFYLAQEGLGISSPDYFCELTPSVAGLLCCQLAYIRSKPPSPPQSKMIGIHFAIAIYLCF